MPTSLASLPQEIVVYHVIPFLDPRSVLNVLTVLQIEVTADIYHACFRDNTRFNEYNLEMFGERVNARLYAIGDNYEDVLCPEGDISDHFETVEDPVLHKDHKRMHTPCLLKSVGSEIVQVYVDFQIQTVDADNRLFFTGKYTQKDGFYANLQTELSLPFDSQSDGRLRDSSYFQGTIGERSVLTEAITRTKGPDWTDVGNPVCVDDSLCPGRVESLFKSPMETHFVDICAREDAMMAVDTRGLVWEWSRVYGSQQGIPVVLADIDEGKPRLFPGPMSKLRMSFRLNSCMIDGLGIAVWSTREPVDGWKGGYPQSGDHFSMAYSFVVPGTRFGIKDYTILGGNICVCLRSNGTVYSAFIRGFGIYGDGSFDKDNDLYNLEELNKLGPFVQMCSARADTFALIKEDGTAVLQNCHWDDSEDRFVAESPDLDTLQGLEVASVSFGLSHSLALTKQGEVYSWGYEQTFNGCLGLGRLKDAKKVGGVEYKNNREAGCLLHTARPVKVELPGRAYGAYAGLNFSAFLVGS